MKPNSGNVLFIILIAVALFAALSYAVTSSTRSGGGDISKEKADLLASEMIQYGTGMKTAILRMMMNGCADTQISFDNPNDSAGRYTNPNAPSDKRCHVFDPAGGGVAWKSTAGVFKFDRNYGTYIFVTGDMAASLPVQNFGTDNRHDLYLTIVHRNDMDNYGTFLAACKAVNKNLSVPEVPANFEKLPTFYHGANNYYFIGTYNDNNSGYPIGRDLYNYSAFCAASTAGIGYIEFVMPLILR